MEIFLQLGYVLIFGSSFPVVIAIALFTFMLEARVDSFKLMKLCQRPHVNPDNDIGIWAQILEGLGKVAVVVNIGLLVFTTKFVEIFYLDSTCETSYRHGEFCVTEVPMQMKVWIFVILENGFLIIKTALAAAIPDISPDTIKQRQRHEHIKMLMIKQNKHTKKKKNDNDDDNEFSQNV